MKRFRFSEQQIVSILRQAEEGKRYSNVAGITLSGESLLEHPSGRRSPIRMGTCRTPMDFRPTDGDCDDETFALMAAVPGCCQFVASSGLHFTVHAAVQGGQPFEPYANRGLSGTR
jgi:hypothetical protein